MTAQIGDCVHYQGKGFDLAGINGSGLFEPKQYGITPGASTTACWRGYYCTYEVADGALWLATLNIGLSEEDRASALRGEGPKIFGKVPHTYTRLGYTRRWFRRVKTEWESWDSIVEGLHERMPFSGGLLLARDFIEELYVHMGFHPAWKFREVHELLFEEGRLIKEKNCSTDISRIRDNILSAPKSEPMNEQEIFDWVDQCFSREYTKKW